MRTALALWSRRRSESVGTADVREWGRGRLIGILATALVVAVVLLVGLIYAVYLAIASVWFFALVETIRSLHLQAWQPFAFSAFIVVTSLMLLVSLSAPRRPETGEPLRLSA